MGMIRGGRALALAALALVLVSGCNRQAKAPASGDFGQRIANADAEPGNWLSTGRDYQEARHSPLTQINPGNVAKLGLAWSYDLDTNRGQEATPIVVDGVIYTSSAWSKVQAFDGVTGKLLWQFDPQVPGKTLVRVCCDAVNRGVAYWEGKVYVGALDGRLIAIDAQTGKQVWSTQTVDESQNYSITGAPRVVKGQVIIGNAGADLGVRGYVSAYDAKTGKLSWRFYLVPGAEGQVDNAASDKALKDVAGPTWAGAPVGGGGGTPWDSFAYDPELNLLYVGAGNSAYWARTIRDPKAKAPMDNLFVGSVVALRPETGEYVWHYQETPGDQWDYTSTQHMILTDLNIGGQVRKVLLHAPKNGFFYVIDRASGKVISAEKFSKVNWASHVDLATGRPVINPEAYYDTTGKVWLGYPSSSGAHSWHPMSFDPKLGLVFLPMMESAQAYGLDPKFKARAKGFNTGINMAGGDTPLPDDPKILAAAAAATKGWLMAWDPVKQRAAWKVPQPGARSGGVLSTAAGLVFHGEIEGSFNAYDSRTGKRLWTFDAQTGVMAAPVTWSKNGVQYVTVMVGSGGAATLGGGPFAVDERGRHLVVNRSRVLTFALDKTGKLPPVEPQAERVPIKVEQFADAAAVKRGRALYHQTCMPCHGFEAIASDMVPDLRYSAVIGDQTVWNTIVRDGALADNGMVGFKGNFTPAETEAIRAYLIERSQAAAKKLAKPG